MEIVEDHNRKLERACHCDFIPTRYKIVTSSLGNMAALFKIEHRETPYYFFGTPEQTIVHEWCYESYQNPNDECDNGEEEDFDIAAFLESK